jgi:hypothetical protein
MSTRSYTRGPNRGRNSFTQSQDEKPEERKTIGGWHRVMLAGKVMAFSPNRAEAERMRAFIGKGAVIVSSPPRLRRKT